MFPIRQLNYIATMKSSQDHLEKQLNPIQSKVTSWLEKEIKNRDHWQQFAVLFAITLWATWIHGNLANYEGNLIYAAKSSAYDFFYFLGAEKLNILVWINLWYHIIVAP